MFVYFIVNEWLTVGHDAHLNFTRSLASVTGVPPHHTWSARIETTLNLYQVQVYHKGERDSPFLPELS